MTTAGHPCPRCSGSILPRGYGEACIQCGYEEPDRLSAEDEAEMAELRAWHQKAHRLRGPDTRVGKQRGGRPRGGA